jgi:hypothetical protein
VTITAKGKLEEGPFIPSFSERPNEIEGDHTFAPGTRFGNMEIREIFSGRKCIYIFVVSCSRQKRSKV